MMNAQRRRTLLLTRVALYSSATLFFLTWMIATTTLHWGSSTGVVGAIPMALVAGWEIVSAERRRRSRPKGHQSE